jgi:hypothetical protein
MCEDKIPSHQKSILIVSYLINQLNINAQVSISVTSNQQISNSTLLSYTSQSPIANNQTLSPVFTSMQLNNTTTFSSANTYGITVTPSLTITTKLPSSMPIHITGLSSTIVNRTRFTANYNRTRMTRMTTAPMRTTTSITQHRYSTTSYNIATKCEHYLTLLILVLFLLFIFPIH